MSRPRGVQLLQGNEACVWGAIDAGARFYAGYPITPSSEIAQKSAELMPKNGGVYIQMEDEIGSMAAIIGASLSGAKSYTATSGPGFSLMQENLGLGIYQEVPCVIVNVQRVGPSTGLATKPAQGDVMQTRWGTHGDHVIIALAPDSVLEMYELTIKAFNLSERFRTPVVLLSDEVIGHLREAISLPDVEQLDIVERKKPQGDPATYLPYKPDEDGIPPMSAYGDKYILHASSSCHDETGCSNSKPETSHKLVTRLKDKIYNYLPEVIMTEEFGPADAEIVIIAYGAVARTGKHVVEQLAQEGKKVRLLRLITIWPFADEQVARAMEQAKAVIVPEMNQGQVIREVNRVNTKNIPVLQVSRTDGQLITPQEIMNKIREAEAL